ncbi:MAG TPA: NAD(P)-dependent oxidoreductase [Thermoanaerobaculia bacterium]|nr:NAD(P)-dependent oxidoreductase [Thermoanaerobaculia bacterium]
MRVVITGAGGLVATALSSRLGEEHEVVLLRHRDLEIGERKAVRERIASLRPDAIVNCAVLGVDLCERDPGAARLVNVEGPANLAEAAESCGAELVHFSSNYVFGGTEEKFYSADDTPDPVNVYGRTKWEGEQAARERCARVHIVRTSWVFGSGKETFLGSVARRLAKGERVRAISDIRASATWVDDLAARVARIMRTGRYATWHIVNGGVCSYETFSREAAALTGADASLIEAISGAEVQRAPRPRHTPMRCSASEAMGWKPLRHWRDALAEYVRTPAAMRGPS